MLGNWGPRAKHTCTIISSQVRGMKDEVQAPKHKARIEETLILRYLESEIIKF